jgi:hypothetical protein
MPWRLIGFVLLLAVLVAFVGLNLGNTSAINLGFLTIENVPVFLSLAIAFLLGALAAIPITITSIRHRDRRRARKPSIPAEVPPKIEERTRRGRRKQQKIPEQEQPKEES